MAKDIIYIDTDDEITAVIDKVESSTEKVLALVLPKHATTFLSSVNMKLLKKIADNAQKSIVLITSDKGIVSLAAIARLHVAKSLQSKPQVPKSPEKNPMQVISFDEASEGDKSELDSLSDTDTADDEVSDNPIVLDNTVVKSASVLAILPKNRKLRVPNFDSFRVKVFLGCLAVILLAVGWVFGTMILPSAKIVLKTEVTPVSVSAEFSASTDSKALDIEKKLLPATLSERKKTLTEKVPATGKKDIGTKATGTISVYKCTDNDITVPAGTVFTNSGVSYSSNADYDIPSSNFFGNGNCKKDRSETVDVTAVKNGDSGNLSAGRDYTSNFASTLSGVGSAMGGGSSNIVTVVSNDDIESAKQKMVDTQKTAAIQEATDQLTVANLLPIPETLKESAPVYTASVAIGAEAPEVTVTSVVTFTMLGVTKDDLTNLVDSQVKMQITDTKQKIQNNGFDKRTIMLVDGSKVNDQKLSIKTTAHIGPDIDVSGVAQEAAGKKRGAIQDSLLQRAGIKDVTISYSPFWVLETPKKPSKINVVVEQINAK